MENNPIEKVLAIVRTMSPSEISQLMEHIQRKLIEKSDIGYDRAKSYYAMVRKLTEGVTGVDSRRRCRRREYMITRRVICYLMYNYGVGVMDISRIMGLNHSSVVYARDRMNEAMLYPKIYLEEARTLYQVQNLINKQNEKDS